MSATALKAEHRKRLAEETRLLSEAEAEAERDGVIPAAEVDRWIDSLGSEKPLSPPKPRRP